MSDSKLGELEAFLKTLKGMEVSVSVYDFRRKKMREYAGIVENYCYSFKDKFADISVDVRNSYAVALSFFGSRVPISKISGEGGILYKNSNLINSGDIKGWNKEVGIEGMIFG